MPPTMAPSAEPLLLGACVTTCSFQHSCLGALTCSKIGVLATTGATSTKSTALAPCTTSVATAATHAIEILRIIWIVLLLWPVGRLYPTMHCGHGSLSTGHEEPALTRN